MKAAYIILISSMAAAFISLGAIFVFAIQPKSQKTFGCITVPGEKGKNGGGDGGSATICGQGGVVISGAGGDGARRN